MSDLKRLFYVASVKSGSNVNIANISYWHRTGKGFQTDNEEKSCRLLLLNDESSDKPLLIYYNP